MTATAESPVGPTTPFERFKAFKQRHHLLFELAFFFAGFLFDVVLLHRIDSTPLLIHQGLYLVASAGLIFLDHRLHVAGKEPEGLLGKVLSVRLWVMHFFLGTLLNAFLIFYFRAAAGLFAMLFIVLLAGIIVINELPRFRQKGPVVRVAMLSFATTNYLAYLLPVIWGELRSWQYYVALLVGSVVTVGLWKLFTRFTHDPAWTFERAVAPGLVIQAVLLILYVAQVVPPVPLSLKHIGAYHDVEPVKDGAKRHYKLTYAKASILRPWAEQAGTIELVPNGKLWVFVKIFAPTRFNDAVQFAWEFDDPQKGWTPWGKPFTTHLSGGNEEGYRTYAYTHAAKVGTYRVRVLTADGREIGRETVDVVHRTEPPTDLVTVLD